MLVLINSNRPNPIGPNALGIRNENMKLYANVNTLLIIFDKTLEDKPSNFFKLILLIIFKI